MGGNGPKTGDVTLCILSTSVPSRLVTKLNHHVVVFTSRSLESTDGKERTNHENSFHEGTQNRRVIAGAVTIVTLLNCHIIAPRF